MDPNAEVKTPKRFFWKGKRVTEKVYLRRLKSIEIAKTILNKHRKKSIETSENKKTEEEEQIKIEDNESVPSCSEIQKSPIKEDEKGSVVNGRRIVNISYLAKNLFCTKCKAILSLEDILVETKHGMASIFHIRCRECSVINLVPTDTTHKDKDNKTRYDTNSRVAIGALSAGMGQTHLNKLLVALNIPELNWNTYKSHRDEVVRAIELDADEAKLSAANEEKDVSMQSTD